MLVGDVPAHNLSGEQIHECGEVQKLAFERQVGEVTHPSVIGNKWTVTLDLILERRWCTSLISSFSPPGFPLVWLDAIQLHASSDSLLANTQCYRDSSVSVAGKLTQD